MMTLIDRVLEPFSLAAQLRRRSRKKALKFRRSDVMLLRYPKSGVTWLRVMISHVYQQRSNLQSSEIIGSTRFHDAMPNVPRVFIGEHIIDPRLTSDMMAAVGRKKTILLIRDPRDVAISMYFHLAKRSTPLERAVYSVPNGFEAEGMFRFVMNPTYGMPRILDFMNTWWEPVNSAANSLIVRYEQMRANPSWTLGEVMQLLGTEASAEEIKESVAFATLEAMKERERSGFFRSRVLRPANKDDEDSYKVRKGEVGGFAQYFTTQELAEIDAVLHSTLDPRIGYV